MPPSKYKSGEKPKWFINRIMSPSRLKPYKYYIPTEKDRFLDDILRTAGKFSYRRRKYFYFYLDIFDKYNIKPIGKVHKYARVEGICTHKNCNKKYNKLLQCLERDKIFLCNEHTQQGKGNKSREIYKNKTPLEKKKVIEKKKKTMLERYGQDNPMKVKKIVEKKEKTNLKKYGFKNPLMKNSVITKKRNETMKKKYGSIYYSQTPEWKGKFNKTCNERYGTNWPMQNSDISEKCMIAHYNTKKYKFPSGNEIYIQGYENFALNILLKQGYKEHDIFTDRKDVPEMWYSCNKDNNYHRYYTDIYIKSENKCIEVKSNWTFTVGCENKDKVSPIIKQKAMKYAGYKCEIWIINEKGEILEIRK